MALPAFFSRVADSLRPVADVDPEVLADKLERVRVRIELASSEPEAHNAFMLACNLAARLYPRISLAVDPDSAHAEDLTARARELILGISPEAEVDVSPVQRADNGPPPGEQRPDVSVASAIEAYDVWLLLGERRNGLDTTTDVKTIHDRITVDASGWNVVVDSTTDTDLEAARQAGHTLSWLAAAAIGMAEVFRTVFAEELGERGRTGRQPGGLNLLTTRSVESAASKSANRANTRVDSLVDIGEVHLIGAGAIGQAAALALSHLEVSGTLYVVDPETVTLSNLQRYLLTDVTSVDEVKVDLVAAALAQRSTAALEVRTLQGRWGDSDGHIEADQVLVALDTARDRITVAATQPRHTYNAWTQVADLGWSRHEQFGSEPCLACLYYPSEVRPSEHELIADALNQHQLRVLAYLTYNLPIGYPLPNIPAIADVPAPQDAERWTQVALIEDLVVSCLINDAEKAKWASTTIGALYRDGICAGGLLPMGDLPGEVLVPLAHQSALAGIMLVAELLWSRDPELKAQRDLAVEHRFDVLRGFPQVVARPRQRTDNCFCGDANHVKLSGAI